MQTVTVNVQNAFCWLSHKPWAICHQPVTWFKLWCSHVDIWGNEDADAAAKAGLDVPITCMRFPVSDLLTCVNQLCVKEWQQLWNQCTSNKLYSVQPTVGRSVSSSLGRYDSVLINRLRISHTRLTNSFFLKGESQPGMSTLPFSAHSQAHIGRLHPLQWSTSELFWSGHTQGRFWKCCN